MAISGICRPDDASRLVEGLLQLSPESRRRRFFFSKGSFSPEELDYFTHCDGVNHLALVQWQPVRKDGTSVRSVACCIRDEIDLSLAEVAIAVADVWHPERFSSKHLPVGEDPIALTSPLAVEYRHFQSRRSHISVKGDAKA